MPDSETGRNSRTTPHLQDVNGNAVTDWLTGGLKYPMDHHLFCPMPTYVAPQAATCRPSST